MRALLVAVALGVVVVGCVTPVPECDSKSCAGCCDATGVCRGGNTSDSCGGQGVSCRACASTDMCTLGQCVPLSTAGGGSATGGGTATGGGAATGGGSATGGGGATGGGASGGGGATGGGGGAPVDCVDDTDCPDATYFFCNTQTSRCEPSCRTASHCNPASIGGTRPAQYALGYCAGALGCQCDEGRCVTAQCSADSDCGAQVCRNGACGAAPVATSVARCEISPSFAVLRQGSSARFSVSAWDAQNAPVVIATGATWSALGSVVSGSGTGHTALFTAGNTPSTTPTASVQAAFGATTCQARVVVLPSPAAGEVAVAVIDELTGRPVPAAKVLLSTTAGAVITQGGNQTVDTDTNGYARLTLTGAPAAYSVSVFHPDFSYLTIANYAGSTRFLSFALRRNPLDTYGGYRGGFSNVPMTSNVHQAKAATSFAGDLTRASIAQLNGPPVPTDVVIGSAINQMDVPISASNYLAFATQDIKADVAALGLNGTCLASGSLDETAIANGACGTSSAWALAMDVPLGDLPIDAIAGGIDNINYRALVPRLSPILRRLHSSVTRDVQFTRIATPFLDAGVPDYTNQSQYTVLTHDFVQVPANFALSVRLPALPLRRGAFVPGAMILGGVDGPARGVVPLGVGLAVDDVPIDGFVNVPGLPLGRMTVRMAPAHHGLENSTYGLVVAALPDRCLASASLELFFLAEPNWNACDGVSALVPRLPSNRLFFDAAAVTPVDLSAQAFPAFPEAARFNFSNVTAGTLPPRSFRLPSALTGMQVARVVFTDGFGTQWEVLVDASSPGFTLPAVPGALRDRLFAFGTASARSDMTVKSLRLRADPSVLTSATIAFPQFVELNESSATRATQLLTAYSSLDYPSPKLSFITPSSNPAFITRGSLLALKVANFAVGSSVLDEGGVRFTFTGGSGCSAVTLFSEVPQAGSGRVELTLPQACNGTVMIRAELVETDGVTPIAPAVATTITATIQ